MFEFLKRQSQTARPTTADLAQTPEPSLPSDVVALLRRRDEINDADLRIHLLDEQRSLARLSDISIWGRLGLVTLDDAEDSNPYVLITRGVCAGMVAHFFHDPEPQVEFATLYGFEAFLLDLRRRRMPLDGEDRFATAHPDQAALAGALRELACADDDDDASWLICLYAPLLRRNPGGALNVLATHDDFGIREAAAAALARVDAPDAAAPAGQVGHRWLRPGGRRSAPFNCRASDGCTLGRLRPVSRQRRSDTLRVPRPTGYGVWYGRADASIPGRTGSACRSTP